MSFAFDVAGIITGITFVEAGSQKVHGEICKIIGTGIRERSAPCKAQTDLPRVGLQRDRLYLRGRGGW